MPAANRLKINVQETIAGTVIHLAGAAGSVESDSLEKALRGVTERQPSVAVVDLSDCESLCTLAIGALVYMYRAMTKQGGSMRIASPKPMVLDSFRRACLHEVFSIFPSVETALK